MTDTHPSPTTLFRWSSQHEDDRFPVENPATGQVITVVQGGGAAEIDGAVRAADNAFKADWRMRTAQDRGRLLLAGADVLQAHGDELATLESLENGKPVVDAWLDVAFLIGVLRFFGGLVDKLPGEFYDQGVIHTAVVQEPFGVVGGIIPFNWPPIHTGGKVAPALAAGNTVVLKPSEQAPLTIMRIVELLNTVLPPDVLHAVAGLGPSTGQALVSHPLVRMVSFTGSTGTGIAVAKAAAENVTPVTLELGGKNALVVFDDADLDRAVGDALDAGYFNTMTSVTIGRRHRTPFQRPRRNNGQKTHHTPLIREMVHGRPRRRCGQRPSPKPASDPETASLTEPDRRAHHGVWITRPVHPGSSSRRGVSGDRGRSARAGTSRHGRDLLR